MIFPEFEELPDNGGYRTELRLLAPDGKWRRIIIISTGPIDKFIKEVYYAQQLTDHKNMDDCLVFINNVPTKISNIDTDQQTEVERLTKLLIPF